MKVENLNTETKNKVFFMPKVGKFISFKINLENHHQETGGPYFSISHVLPSQEKTTFISNMII